MIYSVAEAEALLVEARAAEKITAVAQRAARELYAVEVSAGGSLRCCANEKCGELFVPTDNRQVSCCIRCCWVVRQRRLRAKQRKI